jgi:hypothetical protein
MKITLYETVFQGLQNTTNSTYLSSLVAALTTSVLTTVATYPFDLAHGRMAADMSKKQNIIINKNSPLQ